MSAKVAASRLARAGRAFDMAIEAIVILAFLSFVVLSFGQVILRYLLGMPLTWSEEISRYLFVWVVFLGGGVAARYRGHIVLDFLLGILPRKVRIGLVLAMGVLSLAMLLVLFAWQGWNLTLVSWRQESSATGLPVGCATLAIPVGGVLMALNTIRAFRDDFSGGLST